MYKTIFFTIKIFYTGITKVSNTFQVPLFDQYSEGYSTGNKDFTLLSSINKESNPL